MNPNSQIGAYPRTFNSSEYSITFMIGYLYNNEISPVRALEGENHRFLLRMILHNKDIYHLLKWASLFTT